MAAGTPFWLARKMLIAIAGHLGSGKSTLARALADSTGSTVVGFGDYVRVLAERAGRDCTDRAVLQEIGQRHAEADPAGFVHDLLAHHSLLGRDDLIFDGVRHEPVWTAIQTYADALGTRSMLIFIDTSAEVRRTRLNARNYTQEQIGSWSAHRMENLDGLRSAADVVLDGTGPTVKLAEQVQAASSKSS